MTKIMVVDDQKDIVETLKMIMTKQGFEIETGYSGMEFLEKVQNFNPDLVLMDVMMPGLTTSQILAELEKRGIRVKIILVTVVRFDDMELKNLLETSKNVVDYMKKPFDVNEMIGIVKKHL